MAIHHLDVSLISRGKGHAVTAAAAYRAGVRLVDERTGEVHDYRRRSGVDDAVILTPAGAEPWTRDRGTLWNRAEMAESRRDAQLGRSWVLALPRELDPVTNQRLGREFFERHLVSRGMVVDLAFHELDGDNPHVHGLSSLRDLDGAGFAPRKNRNWNDKELLLECRDGSAALINRYLREESVGRGRCVDHRTLGAQLKAALVQGDYERATELCRLPNRHLGKAATAIVARGERSTRAEDLRLGAEAGAWRVVAMLGQVAEWREEVEGRDRRLRDAWDEVAEKRAVARRARAEAVESRRGGGDLVRVTLTELDSDWRARDAPRVADVDAALAYAETELARIEREHRAEEARRLAEAERERKTRLAEVESKEGGRDLYDAKLDDLDPGWRDRGGPTAECVDAALGHAESELERIAAGRRAADARRLAEEQEQRRARLEAIESKEGGRDLYDAKLDDLDPGWRDRGGPTAECVDAALGHAESELERIAAGRRAADARRLAEEQEQRRARLEAIESKEGGRDLYDAKLNELDPGWRDREEPQAECVDAALSHAEHELAWIEAARRAEDERRQKERERERAGRIQRIRETAEGWKLYSEELDELAPGWRKTREAPAAQIDRALTYAEKELTRRTEAHRAEEERREREREQDERVEQAARRASRVRRVFAVPGGDMALILALDRQKANWREAGASGRDVDTALGIAEGNRHDRASATGHEIVLDAERTFPGASSIEWRGTRGTFRGETDVDDRARAASGLLSDRARAWGIVVGGSDSSASPRVVEQLVEWLGKKIAKLLDLVRRAADGVMAALPGVRRRTGGPAVPAVTGEVLEPGRDADPFVKEVHADVRGRLDRGMASGDGNAGFDHGDRERAQEAYLEPLIDGERRWRERLWKASREGARPTRESTGAGVMEAHRSKIAELILVESFKVAGRPASAEGLERRREEVRRAADGVMAVLPGVQRRTGGPVVPAVTGEVLEPGRDADPFVKEVHADARGRLDRGMASGDGNAEFDHGDRERAQEAYLEPLIDGERRWRERLWEASREGARPTRESTGAGVMEAHRSKIAELILVESFKVAGRPASAEGLERRRDQVRRAADGVMAVLPGVQLRTGGLAVPAVTGEVLEPGRDADPFVKEVHTDVRGRLDRGMASGDGNAGFDHRDRERAQEAYLEPLIDGERRWRERLWEASREGARPTRESTGAGVMEAHRSKIAELILVESFKVAGRPASAEGLERRHEEVRRAADGVMAVLPGVQLRTGGPAVPAVTGEVLEPGRDADPFVKEVHTDVRGRLDRGMASGDGNAGFDHVDRERAQEAYLEPLIDGERRWRERLWEASREGARPTRESTGAGVMEAHRSKIAELILVESFKVAGRPASAEGLERRREEVRRAADGVMEALPRAAPWHGAAEVPAVGDEPWEPAADASPLEVAVYVEVRTRLDRGETADGTERCSDEDRKRAEERYLDALVAETVERQRQACLASERTSRSQRREDIRAAVRRKHGSRLRGILAAACKKSGGDGGGLGDRPGGASARPASGEPACAPGSVAASAEPGSPRGADTGQARSGRPAREPGGAPPQPADEERPSAPASSPAIAAGDPRPRGDASRGTSRARRGKPVEERAPATGVNVPSTASAPGPPSPDTKQGPAGADKKGRGDGGWQR